MPLLAFYSFLRLFILAAIIIVAQSVHPSEGYAFRFTDAITSPRMGATFFGGFVGFLLGNLINRVLRGSRDYAFKSSDWLEIGLILLLIILGIGGEEVVRSSAARISKVSFGATTEIAFSEPQAKPSNRSTEHATNAIKPSGSAESDYLRAGGSAALSINADLGNIIAKDRGYLQLFKTHERQPGLDVDARLRSTEVFVRTAISPFASCLAGIFARTANAAYVNRQLADTIDDFQSVTSQAGDTAANRNTVRGKFVKQMGSIANKAYDVALKDLLDKKAGYSEEEIQFIRACTPLVSFLCILLDPKGKLTGTPWLDAKESTKWLIGNNSAGDIEIKTDNIATATKCMADRFGPKPSPEDVKPLQGSVRPLVSERAPVQQERAPVEIISPDFRKEQDDNLLDQWLPNNVQDEIKELPYFTIAYSGFLAQLGYYDAATLALHNWISQTRDTGFPATWYIPRTRFYLAGYLEEWIRIRGDSTPLSLRQYHIDNFAAIIGVMANRPTIAEIQRLSGDSKLDIGLLGATHSGDNGDCNTPIPEEKKPLGALYQSYISALAGFVDHSLKHRENAKRNASTISSYTQQLNKLSLKCLDDDIKKEKRAEILEYYARNQLNLVENTAALKGADALQQQLKDAAQVVRLAIELIYKQQSDERNDKATKSFLLRISSSSIIERYESLLVTQEKVNDMERQLSGN